MSLRELFGSAITLDLPSNLLDASDLRPVPDTQEVFLSPDSDVSFVIEILQRVDASDAEDAAKFHFDSLAHDNAATSQRVLEITVPNEQPNTSPSATPHAIFLFGQQEVRKFNRPTSDQVRILLALYRVESKGIDLVLTANVPQTSAGSHQPDDEIWVRVKQIFEIAAASLKIVDFGLFA